jgi:hypothetical protein
MLAPVNLD